MTDHERAARIVHALTGIAPDDWATHECGHICRAWAERLAADAPFMAEARVDLDAAIATLLSISLETARAIGEHVRRHRLAA